MAAFGKLASSVTHELGQPVTAMRSYLTAHEISKGPDTTTAKLQRLVDRMQRILEELRAFSRPVTVRFSPVDLSSSIRTSLDLLRPNIAAADVTIKWENRGSPVRINGDQMRIEQAFVNVIRNAIDVMANTDRRELEISLQTNKNRAVISFADRGPGFGSISLETLTEPFYTTRASGNGMGLGLAVTAEIVEEHDGTLLATNREDGGGIMVFSFALIESEDESIAAE
jgi:two-component system C4-dicarboxylate transport sensor histidine kinase DctB